MLSLISEKWESLQGPYGNGRHIPLQIKQLQQDYNQEQAHELYYEELYHQNTIYPCTYVTVPYLVELALNATELETSLDIYIVCGMFEAWSELPLEDSQNTAPEEWHVYFAGFDVAEVEDIYQSYRQALKALEAVQIDATTYVDRIEESEKIYLLSAISALQGYHTWAKCFLTYSGGEEYIVDCSHCHQSIYIWTDENSELTEWRAYSADPAIDKKVNYTKVIPNQKDQNQMDLKWLYMYMNQLQMTSWLAQLPYLEGKVNCPHCSDDISIKEALLDSIS